VITIISKADARHDATETLVGGGPTTVIHDQTVANGETRLAGELGVNNWLAAGLILPFRLYNTSIRYLDPGGQQVQIENPFIHHHNETLTGVGDPWIYGRADMGRGGLRIGGRVGLTIPLGRTVPDPFVLGDMGLPHEHSQFGTGTIGAIAGVDVSGVVGGVHVDAGLLTIQTFYANGYGYQAGDRYGAVVGAASGLGTKQWRFRATVEGVKETAETWSGIVHTDDGNVGRVDVVAGAEATWLINDDWHVGVSIKVPAYTHIEGGQLDSLGFAGVSVGTHFHLFGEGAHTHAHDDGPTASPGDWTGLDEADASPDGSAVALVPVPGKITVFDFWATWCKPCGVVDHELAEVARRHPNDLAVRKMNASDPDSPASQKYLGSATLPHLKVFGRDGKLLWERSAPPLELTSEVEKAIAGPRVRPPVDPDAPRVQIEVNDAGFAPARVEVEHGRPATLVFTRRSKTTCATDVHFRLSDGTRIDELLPLGQAVEIPLPAQPAGDIPYSCGMNMNHGTIVVK
jgi:thiol-disulfide isomerase/thioredoxin